MFYNYFLSKCNPQINSTFAAVYSFCSCFCPSFFMKRKITAINLKPQINRCTQKRLHQHIATQPVFEYNQMFFKVQTHRPKQEFPHYGNHSPSVFRYNVPALFSHHAQGKFYESALYPDIQIIDHFEIITMSREGLNSLDTGIELMHSSEN